MLLNMVKLSNVRIAKSVFLLDLVKYFNIPLHKWFMAIYLIVNHKKGISSLQLGRDIDVTQKYAWFMLHRLHHANKTKSFEFQGTVEADEWLMIDSTIVRAHQSPDVKKKARKRVFLECLNMKRNN